ncbi:cystine transport system substrate-binding protein [Herbaspirillum sp. Sphag1AN]|uniref:transporter substrate-binding domain-containing protein n=1 Tax=unclassified Herbaspirillum TaxID=2624150 RepID=UPI0016212EFE|nr:MULTISPECIES: transporter substrate-binding domain-containing protein [unclassified Herbaspirillum]MBB3213089.1 cystine transport system substrate-binding protein [Herbaspirillum sp. Sphag1AN]MBB3246286.1 cystine transport system substrate-binding protein [Herbaspirillum sp. Sphag64]
MLKHFFLMLRIALALCLALVLQQAHASGDDSLSRLQQRGVVYVANTQASPPWSYLDEKNQPDGYDVAVAREIFRRIGIAKVEFVADKFKNFVEGIRAQKYDVVVNSMARTPEREKVVDFSAPYTVQDFRIWVNEKNREIHDKSSLRGKSVGVSTGTSNELWARANLPDSEVRGYEGGGFEFNDLISGRLDAIIESYFNGYKMKTVNKLPINTVGEPLLYSLGAAILPKNSTALKNAMDKAIGDMITDGTIQKLAHQYVGSDYDMTGNMQKAVKN